VDAILIEIEETEEGLVGIDLIRQSRVELRFDGEFYPTDTEVVEFPVDEAVRIEANRVIFPVPTSVWIRKDGKHFATTSAKDEKRTFVSEMTPIQMDIASPPVKTHLVAENTVSVETIENQTVIEATGGGFVLGVRSLHDRPAGTVTTTEKPRDIMRAISTFGSALKTTTPERSWPTLRGHPPELTLGEEFDVPDFIERPDTDIQIEIPLQESAINAVAPLAYYLGAEVCPTSGTPQLVADRYTQQLGVNEPIWKSVERIFPQLFLFDIGVRSTGIYETTTENSKKLEQRIGTDFARLYDLPIDQRTAEYLRPEYDTIKDILPEWQLTATVAPKPENLEFLPYLATELAFVRPPQKREVVDASPSLEGFLRNDNDASTRNLLSAYDLDTPRHQWVGEDLPLRASRPTVGSLRRQLSRSPADDSTISVSVVCNDEQMLDELSCELYPKHELVSLDVTVKTELSSTELREILRTDTDFFHYIGHAREDGVQCTDGWLDLRSLDSTGVDAFLLNGCQSLRQGEALVDAGALGGVVSLSDIGNVRATTLGQELSRLLAYGHSLGISLYILRQADLAGRFAIVGLDRFCLVRSPVGIPIVFRVEKEQLPMDVTVFAYPTPEFGVGSVIQPHIQNAGWHLNSGEVTTYQVASEEDKELLTDVDTPVLYGEELRWSQSLVR
jgi:hypothetical protein